MSVAMSAATIVLAIIAGWLFRATFRFIHGFRLYGLWRVTVYMLVFIGVLLLEILTPLVPYEIVYEGPLLVLASCKSPIIMIEG